MKVKKLGLAVAVVLAAVLMVSCNKKHEKHLRLLKSMTENVGGEAYTRNFTYDENGRITVCDVEKYLYPTPDSIYIFQYYGDTVYCHLNAQGYIDNYTHDGKVCKIYYDSEGHYIGNSDDESAKWYNGNLVKVQYGAYYADLTYTNIKNVCESFDMNYVMGMTEWLGLMGGGELYMLKWFGFLGKGCKYLKATEADYNYSYTLDDAGYVTEITVQSYDDTEYKLLFTWDDVIVEVE